LHLQVLAHMQICDNAITGYDRDLHALLNERQLATLRLHMADRRDKLIPCQMRSKLCHHNKAVVNLFV